MAFHFPLEAVLHFRKSVEHQQELRLRAINQIVARMRRLIEQIGDRICAARSQQLQQLSAGMTAAELRFALQSESTLGEQRQTMQRELTRLESLRDQQQQIFQQARRERETFESLREHECRIYAREATRREQRQQDDLFLLRQAYLRQIYLRRG
jgi:flagellar export protein FliJ